MNACLKDCLKEVPETELIRRVVAGDDAAFETFYEKHRRQVYAVCFTATKKHEVAEDISQVVWSGVRRSLASFNGDCKVATFLQAITQHQIASYFRKEKRQNLASESLDAPKRYAPNPDNDENPREPKAGDPNLVGLVDRVDIERAIAK